MKFRQNPELKRKLLATENKVLVEATLNRYREAGITRATENKQKRNGENVRYPGSNQLGHQLHDVHRELREIIEQAESQRTNVKVADTANRFSTIMNGHSTKHRQTIPANYYHFQNIDTRKST